MRIDVIDIKYQPDCIFIYTSDRVDGSIEILPFKKICPGYGRTKCIIKTADKRELEKAIQVMNSYPELKSLNIIYKKDDLAEISLVTNITELYDRIRDYGGFILGTMSVEGGNEKWLVTFDDLDSRKVAIDFLKDMEDVELSYTLDISPEFFCWLFKSYESLISFFETIKGLRESQIKLLKEILEEGYYDWPRKVNITDISSRSNVSKAAISRKIRNIERSILTSISKLL